VAEGPAHPEQQPIEHIEAPEDEGQQELLRRLNTSVPHSARIWNYLLGGKDNFQVDRQAGDLVSQVFPGMVAMTRQSRQMLIHARALLSSTPGGACDYLDANVRDPETILHEATSTLDFSRPTALMLMGILGLVEDYDQARSVVRQLMDALPSGS
jgi:S-adenosyl methyltransferase